MGIKKKYEKLRRRYPEVHGKKVDWISYWHEEGYLSFNVRFTDGKNFSILCSPTIVTNVVDFSDVKTGDSVIIREYYRRRQEGLGNRPRPAFKNEVLKPRNFSRPSQPPLGRHQI